MSFWNYDTSSSWEDECYLDSGTLGLTVMLLRVEEGIELSVFPLSVADEPLYQNIIPNGVLPENYAFGEPEMGSEAERERVHVPLGEDYQFLVNATHEGLILDLYDNESVFWSVGLLYDEDLEVPEDVYAVG